jgi:DNA primase
MNPGDRKTRHGEVGLGQTELFGTAPESAARAPAKPVLKKAGKASAKPPVSDARAAAPNVPDQRVEAFETLLAHCAPVRAGSREASWLKDHRIFRKTWLAQGLRVVTDYRSASNGLLARFTPEALAAWGLFNREGHLRFYRHTLIVPWFDGARPQHLQACSPDPQAKTPLLSTSGTPPLPYHAAALDGAPGRLYLCAGALATLELLEAGFPAAGADEDGFLSASWLPRFRGKSVYVAYAHDAEGEAAAVRALTLMTEAGIEAHRLHPPG